MFLTVASESLESDDEDESNDDQHDEVNLCMDNETVYINKSLEEKLSNTSFCYGLGFKAT